jgi:hypothetical protein
VVVAPEWFGVSGTGYFLFLNIDKARITFDCRLNFTAQVMPYTGSHSWVERTLLDAYACLNSPTAPAPSPSCHWCSYRNHREETIMKAQRSGG